MPAARTVRRRPRRRRGLLTAAAATVGALLLASCSALAPAPSTTVMSTADSAIIGPVEAELHSYYAQTVTWTACNGGFQCTKVEVPMDYAKPMGASIKLAVTRLPASGKRLGAMLINPGGPGASGVDLAKDGAKSYFSPKLRAAYDIVGFDPRGVQRSAPVKCQTDAQMDAERQESFNLALDADLRRAEERTREDVAACVKNSGPALAHVDTVSSARDMDILRAVSGDPKLNYMGFSYGTKLGATYAGLFPGRVGKMSLDGALDPSLDIDQVSLGQAVGFENALRAWAGECLGTADCPVTGTVDAAMKQIRDLNAVYEETPQRANEGRLVTGTEFTNALAFAMYSTDLWEPLTGALKRAFAGDASGMLMLADYSADRDSDGKYQSNTAAAFTAVNCLDYPMNSDIAHMREEAATLQRVSPTFGKLLAYSGLGCKYWPFPASGKPAPIAAPGAGPILVIGTTGDPATPYQWAKSLAGQLESGVLVTWKGQGHTAYGRANSCLTNVVDNYFVNGKVPAAGTTC
ncbi:alpha/beta hydrolase [Specibacter sp. RAF43]|uniref:alpha/beta hydrolase n=1 Tax=Specibacter sp. RAF43 TaxID=3233057 RepID=UPI003F98D645